MPSSQRLRRLQRDLLVVTAVAVVVGVGVTTTATASAPVADPTVVRYQHALAEAGFYRGEIDGLAGPMTVAAVITFQKAVGLERDGVWNPIDFRHLERLTTRVPGRPDEPDRVEVDLTNQVGYLVLGGELTGVFGISSGNGEVYQHPAGYTGVANTPQGDFTFLRHYEGVRQAPLGELYRPWYFKGGFALHGSPSVPAHPASHGCIRVTNWDADWLSEHLELGMPVHVWTGDPRRPEALPYDGPVGIERLGVAVI